MHSTVPSRYQRSLEYLYGLQKYGIKFGLNQTENLLHRVGNPHRQLRCIHIAGTNGKGSTAAMLSSIMKRQGLKVGLYTSPHLVRFTERFRINEREAPAEDVLSVFDRICRTIDESEPPTFFEMITAMAFLYFAEEKVDWAIMETGMGGRLDATNVVDPQIAVITNVSFDHQDFLGKNLADIAREKAGIIKPGRPLVTAVRQPVAQAILKTSCLKKEAPLYRLSRDFKVRRNEDGSFRYDGLHRQWASLHIGLRGFHQINNAALSLAVLEVLENRGHFALDPIAVEQGLLEVHWPARLETLQERPLIILDGAHNPDGAERLREALKSFPSYRKLHLVVGVMGDKDIKGIFRRLLPIADTVIFTKPRYARSADPEKLMLMAKPYIQQGYVIPDAAAAIERARNFAGSEDVICITGSLYFAGEVKEIFGEPAL